MGAQQSTQIALPPQHRDETLQSLGIRRLDPHALRRHGWENMPGVPLYIEHHDMGLVQLVARHTEGLGAERVTYAVRRVNPLAGAGESAYEGDYYTIPKENTVALHYAITEFHPSEHEGGALGEQGQGYVSVLSQHDTVYRVPWSKMQAVIALSLDDPHLKDKVRILNIEFLNRKSDLVEVQRAVRLLERDHPDMRSWTSVKLSDREVWGSRLSAPADAAHHVGSVPSSALSEQWK